jgi:predicted negative regulator of RcsB-dependent stress response
MSIDLMDEHERGERVRRWLHENGSALLGGVGIGLLAFFGWQWHERGQQQVKAEAAVQFHSLYKASEAGNADTVIDLAEGIGKTFGETPYATLALLQLADQKLGAGDMDAAADALQKAREGSKDALLSQLASLRLARVRYSQGNLDDALALLESSVAAYPGLAAELRGDILRAQGKNEEAVEAYQDALVRLEEGVPTRSLVELKLADLGASAPQES